MGLIADLGTELEAFRPGDMAEVVEFTESAEARLGSLTTQPAAALQQAPAFPLVSPAPSVASPLVV